MEYLVLIFIYIISFLLESQFHVVMLIMITLFMMKKVYELDKIWIIPSFFIFVYLFPFYHYFFLDTKISYYIKYNNLENIVEVFKQLYLFIILFYLFLEYDIKKFKFKRVNYSKEKKMKSKKGKLMFYIYIILFLVINLLVIYESSKKIGGYKSVSSSLTEYSYILYLLGYKYSFGKNKKRVHIGIGILIILLIFSLGSRIQGVQLGIIIFFLYFSDKFNKKKQLLYAGIGYIVMKFIGTFRANTSIVELFMDTKKAYLVNNAADIIYAGVVFNHANKYLFTPNMRISSLFLYLKNIFMKRSGGDLGILSSYLQNHVAFYGGGGFIFNYFIIWFGGITGVILSCYIITTVLKKSFLSKRMFDSLNFILIVALIPRWFVYDPITFLKLPLCFMIIYYLDRVVQKIIRN